jgi:hypothetical protein
MSESSSLVFLNNQDNNTNSRSTNNILVAAAASATYTVVLPSNKSSSSLLTTNSSQRLKMLKQHNLELEQHMRQQQKKDHYQQDSFLKKFSYITKTKNQQKSTKRHLSPFENYDNRKEKNKHFHRRSSIFLSNLSDIDSCSISSKNANRLGIVSNTNSPIISLKHNHSENTNDDNINNVNMSNKDIVHLNSFNNNNEDNNNSNHNNNIWEKSRKRFFLFFSNDSKSFDKNNSNYSENKSFMLTIADVNVKNDLKMNQNDKLSQEYSNTSFSSKNSKKYLFKSYVNRFLTKFNYFVLSPDDNCVFIWLIILNICVLYNLWLIIARQSFEKLQTLFESYWKITDALSDIIYLIDVIVQFRTGYLEQGLLVYNSKKLAINYVKSKQFLFDIFSLAPFELIEYKLNFSMPILRFPRFFKLYRLVELYYIFESRTLYPNVWRVANLTHILFLLGHWFAGFYFLISKAEDFKGIKNCIIKIIRNFYYFTLTHFSIQQNFIKRIFF